MTRKVGKSKSKQKVIMQEENSQSREQACYYMFVCCINAKMALQCAKHEHSNVFIIDFPRS